MKDYDKINQATKTDRPGGYAPFGARGGVQKKIRGSQLDTLAENFLVYGP